MKSHIRDRQKERKKKLEPHKEMTSQEKKTLHSKLEYSGRAIPKSAKQLRRVNLLVRRKILKLKKLAGAK